ncbi:hypothetical protein [Roseibacillus persicicus]|uniref:PEP-CTERM protein-sorting domain-containing protein n=1 Tax=Roseibacillus persicicus TaxID=454148 RepID=A0A918TBP0_9BACT|nr:hypothetical protein [Roseibacillus persicicus]GHC41312.1 hypothetical protein GCM10007100_02530 [Roseibacillus persicicus]
MKISSRVLLFSLTLASASNAAVIDVLDDLSNFGTPHFSSLNLLPGGEMSFISEAASEDRVVSWMRDGSVRLGLDTESLVTVVPTGQVNAGEWGLWAVYFDGNAFNDEVNLLGFTSSTATVSFDVKAFAPASADSYFLHFRVKEAAGDGFTFTEIRAVPEPGTAFLAGLALFPLLRRNRRPA